MIGRKKIKRLKTRTNLKEVAFEFPKVEEISLLPMDYQGNRIKVNPSFATGITTFTTKEFHFERALNYVKKSSLRKFVKEITQQELYMSDRLSRPPIMPNAGQMYLMAISGAGQGIVGFGRKQKILVFELQEETDIIECRMTNDVRKSYKKERIVLGDSDLISNPITGESVEIFEADWIEFWKKCSTWSYQTYYKTSSRVCNYIRELFLSKN